MVKFVGWRLPNGDPFVGAHYCLWYRDDWGVSNRPKGSRTIFSPVRGSYQSSDEEIMRQHIEEAVGAGINTFCCSWKPPERRESKVEDGWTKPWNAKGIENYENENLRKLVDIVKDVDREGFFVTVILENNRLRDEYLNDLDYALITEDTKAINRDGKLAGCHALTKSETIRRYVKVISYLLRKYGRNSWLQMVDPKGKEKFVITVFTVPTQLSYDEESLGKFQEWIRQRYPSLNDVNNAWRTAYKKWSEVKPSFEGRRRSDSLKWFKKAVEDGWTKIAEGVKKETGRELAIFGYGMSSPLNEPALNGTHVAEMKGGLDGFIDYGDGPKGVDHTLYKLDRGTLVNLCKKRGKFSALTCVPGFDTRYLPAAGRRINDYTPKDPEEYGRRLGTIISLKPTGLFITSYNEWWENTAVEPAKEYGTTFLDICRKYVTAYKKFASKFEKT